MSNWITDILGGVVSGSASIANQSLSGASGNSLAGLDPALAGLLSSLGPTSPEADPTASSPEVPTLQQLLVQSARETDSRFAFSGNTPRLVRRTFGLAGDGDLAEGDYLVFMGGAPDQYEHQTGPAEPVAAGAHGIGGRSFDLGVPTGTVEKSGGDKILTAAQAADLPYLWDQDKITKSMERMQAAGIEVKTFDDMVSVWQGLVSRASKSYTLSDGEKQLTPWDVLDLYKSETGEEDSSGAYTGTRTSTSRSVNELTEGQSWSVLQGTLQKMLGRDPSDQELRNFTYKMSQAAARNPSVTKTISHYKDGYLTGSNSHTSGGFTMDDAMEKAYDRAQNNPDYAEYQSATTYFNAALSALGPIGG